MTQETGFSAGLTRAWDYEQPRDQWHEITEEDADYCLGVLPPIYFRGGFAVSEPVIHNAKNEPVYLCVVRARGQLFARLASITEVESEARP
jgi:hypothetical protein